MPIWEWVHFGPTHHTAPLGHHMKGSPMTTTTKATKLPATKKSSTKKSSTKKTRKPSAKAQASTLRDTATGILDLLASRPKAPNVRTLCAPTGPSAVATYADAATAWMSQLTAHLRTLEGITSTDASVRITDPRTGASRSYNAAALAKAVRGERDTVWARNAQLS